MNPRYCNLYLNEHRFLPDKHRGSLTGAPAESQTKFVAFLAETRSSETLSKTSRERREKKSADGRNRGHDHACAGARAAAQESKGGQ